MIVRIALVVQHILETLLTLNLAGNVIQLNIKNENQNINLNIQFKL